MKKTYILYSVLVATALSVNPLYATKLSVTPIQTNKRNSLSFGIAKILYNRGINSDSAIKISENFFADTTEDFFVMIKNIEDISSSLNEDDIMEYLSSLALQRKTIDLSSYDSLVKMFQSIKQVTPSKNNLEELHSIAKVNFRYSKECYSFKA